MSRIYGALEAGGTKMVLSILDEEGTMTERVSIPTEGPNHTVNVMIDFFSKHHIDALGIGSFGPLDLNPESPTYGYITATPKLAWRNYPLMPVLQTALQVPVALDTDVNASALAEMELGAARGLESCVYVTVGTGVGGGFCFEGKTIHGLMHPEMGHMLLTSDPRDPAPVGYCPYHQHCLEGLASGPSLEKRWGMSGKDIPQDHVAWEIESEYLSQMCHNIMMTLSPSKIILGGGVMTQKFLFPMIREKTVKSLGNYVNSAVVENGLVDYIVEPGLGVNSGVTGAWLLAKRAMENQ